jgi:hypothetical protein
MPSQDIPISYSRDFMTWLGCSIFLLPLTTSRYRPVLDAFIAELVTFYDYYKTTFPDPFTAGDIDELASAFPLQELVDRVREKVSACSIPRRYNALAVRRVQTHHL